MTATVLMVTSAGAGPAAVVPVMAALEAAELKVRAVDIGGAGGGGPGVGDRFRRAILGETAQRKLRREVTASPPDVAVVFDPHAGLAMTVVRDETSIAMPVVAVVSELAPGLAWAQTDADRFLVVDDHAAVTLAGHGVEADRIVVTGAFGPLVFASAGQQSPSTIRQQFKLGERVVVVVIAGMAPDQVGQLLLQLSLRSESTGAPLTFLFDAGNDVESASMVRKQVPALGLRGKLFGAIADAPLFWRAAQAVIAKPTVAIIACASLAGVPLVALCEDAPHQELGVELQLRGRGVVASSTLMISGALDAMLGRPGVIPLADGAWICADAVSTIAAQKCDVVEERRGVTANQVRSRVRAVNTAAAVNASRVTPATGLEDLTDKPTPQPGAVDAPDTEELETLRRQMRQRLAQLRQTVTSSRIAADRHGDLAQQARQSNDTSLASVHERHADVERARMHAVLADMASLESELQQLERLSPGPKRSEAGNPRAAQLDDELNAMKAKATTTPVTAPPRSVSAKPVDTVDDELAALKRKMASMPGKMKP